MTSINNTKLKSSRKIDLTINRLEKYLKTLLIIHNMKNICIILENIRSSYNVGNIIRTADALWADVILSWYTAHPDDQEKVLKSSLGAEKSTQIKQFRNTKEALEYAKIHYKNLIAAEITQSSIPLQNIPSKNIHTIAVVVGNETDWVLPDTLNFVDEIYHIPMMWIKESLNVGQTAAIFLRELRKLFL